MQMTNKTQSQMIGTALPSDLPSEPSADSMIDHIHTSGYAGAEAPVYGGSPLCAHCGAKIGACNVGRPRTKELILNCICAALLIASVLCVGHLLNSLAEHRFDKLFDRWVWHEPLDEWNL